jgi:hypothetical protein
LRIAPPLTITGDELTLASVMLKKVLDDAQKQS